jgi:hypothetical protein
MRLTSSKLFGKKRLWPSFKAISRNLPGETEENHQNLSKYSRPPGRDLNVGIVEYEAEVLTTRPRRSVGFLLNTENLKYVS